MTQTFASTALPVQAAQGGLGASVLIHLSGLQARKLGLQPGQLLQGEVKPGSSGPDLLIAGISVPLPVGATVGAGGALTVQALLMRGGWILRSLTGEHTEQLVRTGSAPSGLAPSGSVPSGAAPSGSVLSGPAPSGPGSAPAVSPQTAGQLAEPYGHDGWFVTGRNRSGRRSQCCSGRRHAPHRRGLGRSERLDPACSCLISFTLPVCFEPIGAGCRWTN